MTGRIVTSEETRRLLEAALNEPIEPDPHAENQRLVELFCCSGMSTGQAFLFAAAPDLAYTVEQLNNVTLHHRESDRVSEAYDVFLLDQPIGYVYNEGGRLWDAGIGDGVVSVHRSQAAAVQALLVRSGL